MMKKSLERAVTEITLKMEAVSIEALGNAAPAPNRTTLERL